MLFKSLRIKMSKNKASIRTSPLRTCVTEERKAVYAIRYFRTPRLELSNHCGHC